MQVRQLPCDEESRMSGIQARHVTYLLSSVETIFAIQTPTAWLLKPADKWSKIVSKQNFRFIDVVLHKHTKALLHEYLRDECDVLTSDLLISKFKPDAHAKFSLEPQLNMENSPVIRSNAHTTWILLDDSVRCLTRILMASNQDLQKQLIAEVSLFLICFLAL